MSRAASEEHEADAALEQAAGDPARVAASLTIRSTLRGSGSLEPRRDFAAVNADELGMGPKRVIGAGVSP